MQRIKKEKYHLARNELNDLLSEKGGNSTGVSVLVKEYPNEKIFEDENDLDIIYQTEGSFSIIYNIFNEQYETLKRNL